LLRAIAGLDRADAGEIAFQGRLIQRLPPNRRVGLGLSLVPEGRHLFPRLTVERNLDLGGWTRKDRREKAESLDLVYSTFPVLGERRRQLAGTLSGGEQQMLAIGRGLMSEPRLLILDEPSLGLSPIMVEEIFALVGELHRQGLSILLIEQNAMQSLAAADRAYIIERGLVAMSGPAAELAANPALRARYLGL
jgi:branched-chain amino acid transport system ATP-binding protein